MKKKDFILIGAIAAVIAIASLVLFLTKKDGDHVIVRVDGNEVAKYSLSQDGEYALNGGTNILRIEGGKAYLVSADCPDHLCVKQGTISKSGETITCLPNRLTVTVYSAEGNEVELVS
ncbi:MAG: NusG domain II-containing protein [Oscillospiraceae bacterium]|nr:NusG domain II-containing protein [Oscillospiraceae bacterium]